MTSFTTYYGLPYPDDTDLVIEGDDAVQALAEKVAAILRPAYLNTAHIAGSTQKAATGGVNVAWGGVDQSGHFTAVDAALLRYDGPARSFAVTATVSLDMTAGGAGSMRLLINSNIVRVALSPVGEASGANRFTGTLSWCGALAPGDVIGVGAFGPDSADIVSPAISIHSIGPATA